MPRKLRRFLGLLMNAETCLQSTGYNLREAYAYAVGEHDRIEAHLSLHGQRTDEQIDLVEAYDAAAAQAELCQRTQHLVHWIETREPRHALLPTARTLLGRWQDDRRADQSPPPPIGDKDVNNPDIRTTEHSHEISQEDLNLLYARFCALDLPHESSARFLMFLYGLYTADRKREPRTSSASTTSLSGLRETAQASLAKAVEFALLEESQALIERHVTIPGDREFHALFMGLAYVAQNPTLEEKLWMRGSRPKEEGLRLLHTMGILSAEDPRARRLILKILGRLPALIGEAFGEEAVQLIANGSTGQS